MYKSINQLLASFATVLVSVVLLSHAATAQTTEAASASQLEEIVVTAQKRQQNINDVGMSIQAATGDQLIKLGVTAPADLQKIVPGFSAVNSQYGTPVYTIRGVGFQDSALASSPTVSVYVDEVPLPFSIMTSGTTLDVQRVEVLKGPQGTLFGENATGGAVNFIANKPTNTLEAGLDASYGRFNSTNLQGFVSGPATDTLDYRVAIQSLQSDAWQQSYTHNASLGSQEFFNGRASLVWRPSDQLHVLFTASGFLDRSETQAAQYYRFMLRGQSPPPAGYVAYPSAPHDDRAADWSSCVPASASGNCIGYKKDNKFYSGSLRIDYDLPGDLTLTSLTAYEHFNRFEPQDEDGTTYNNYSDLLQGYLKTTYQELRLSGKLGERGNWIVGGNYEHDNSSDSFLENFTDSSENPTFGLRLTDAIPASTQAVSTYAAFANIDYPLLSTVSVTAGVRYTKQDRTFAGCSRDAGDGQWNDVTTLLTEVLTGAPAVNPGPGACGSLGPAPAFAGGIYQSTLNQDNVSWHAGVNWTGLPDTLVYLSVSRGYKSGSFPTLGASVNSQFSPVVQEELQSYEGGFKALLFNKTLQINAAGYYYDYTNKQIIGDIFSEIFGGLDALVNIPKSNVVGFELSGAWKPTSGLTITPSVSFAGSKIDGNFTNYNPFGKQGNFEGESFPYAPRWQADLDAQYEWILGEHVKAFIGANDSYQGRTNAGLGDLSIMNVPGYSLIDLRAGIEKDSWRFQLWGRNVTNQYYWTSAYWAADAVTHFTGRPATYGVTVSYRYK